MFHHGLPLALASSALVAGALAGLAPAATAHCDLGAQPAINRQFLEPLNGAVEDATGVDPGLHLCFNDGPEAALAVLNAQANETGVAYTYIEYQRFHPDVLHIPSGGAVVFLWADAEEGTLPTVFHSITNSGPCEDPAADPETAPKACRPTAGGACFDSEADVGRIPRDGALGYRLGLAYDAATGLVTHAAQGGGEDACPPDSAIAGPAKAVVPFHCRYHGVQDEPRGPEYGKMRATVVVWA